MRGLVRDIHSSPRAAHKPFLYVGGKVAMLDTIIKKILSTPARVYVEPFCGSATVFFKLPRFEVEVLSDINDVVITVLRVMQDKSGAERLATLFELSLLDTEVYSILSRAEPAIPLVSAWRFIYMKYMSFLGVSGKLPFFMTRSGVAVKARYVDMFRERLRGVRLYNRDAIDVIREYDSPETVFFLDPPYPGRGNDYIVSARDVMDLNERLAALLPLLRGRFVLTCYPDTLYERAGFMREEFVRGKDLMFGRKVREVIYSNF